MSFERMVPGSAGQLHQFLSELHSNRQHVVSAKINESSGQLQVDLSGLANFSGKPDFYVPIRRSKLREAQVLLDRLLLSEHAASLSDAQALFDLIDPLGS